MADYNKSSPYFATAQSKSELSILALRHIPSERDDMEYTIAKEFEYRPDLLAYDVYKDTGLWWVFTNRNPDIIKDPIFDFKAGTTIRLPKKSTLSAVLGI